MGRGGSACGGRVGSVVSDKEVDSCGDVLDPTYSIPWFMFSVTPIQLFSFTY